MNKQEPKTKDEARQYAIEWQQWASEQGYLHYSELAEWNAIFWAIAKKYHLVREFKTNGII